MTTAEFQLFVSQRDVWFRGRLPETAATLAAVEASLGVQLPRSLCWLLTEYGYWHGTAVSNLDDSVRDTHLARQHHELPSHFVVLENHGDGGLILIDTSQESSPGEPVLYWAGSEDLGASPRLEGNSRYDSYGAYVAATLETKREFVPETEIAYDASRYEPKRTDA